MQRDVEIDVENTDKVGGFIGTLYINRENFAKLLLEEGLATVHAYSAEQSGNATELFAAEQKAKDARKGLWHDHDPTVTSPSNPEEPSNSTAASGSTAANGAPAQEDYRDALITHIDQATCTLKIQLISPTTTVPLASLMSAFRAFHLSPGGAAASSALPGPPKTGDLVAAKYSADGEWYRARVRRNDREARHADVLFLDYGNTEIVPWLSLRTLSQPEFSLQKLKSQAIDAVMAGLRFPEREDYLAEAVKYLEENIGEKECVVKVVGGSEAGGSGGLKVVVYVGEVDMNSAVVEAGFATVPATTDAGLDRTWVATLREKQEEANNHHLGVWEYGDLTED